MGRRIKALCRPELAGELVKEGAYPFDTGAPDAVARLGEGAGGSGAARTNGDRVRRWTMPLPCAASSASAVSIAIG